MSNGLSSIGALAYQGTNAPTPPNITVQNVAPLPTNYQGFSIGDFWVYRISKTSNNSQLWVLLGVAGNVADWVMLSASVGTIITLTGNTGGAVSPLLGNINVVGDGTTIDVVGNPATHTLTISAIGTGILETLTGNSGGAVSPLAGNINVVGDGTTINVVGNPGTHTLTISAVSGTGLVDSLTTDDGHIVTPTAGTIIVHGGNNITTTGTVGPNTVTINVSGTTNNAIQVGSATGSLTSLAVVNDGVLITSNAGVPSLLANGTTGQVLTATTGSTPSWQSAPGGALTLIQTQTASGVAVLNFTTGISSTYNNYRLLCDSVNNAVGSSTIYVQLSTNGGSTYITTGYCTAFSNNDIGLTVCSGGTATVYGSAAQDLLNLTSGTRYIISMGNGVDLNTAVPAITINSSVAGAAYSVAATTVNALRVTIDNATLFTGTFSLFGYSK